MAVSLPTEEIGRRGKELYERLRSRVEKDHAGRILAVDVESGDFEIGDDYQELTQRLHARRTNAPVYVTRIGFAAVGRMGARAARKA